MGYCFGRTTARRALVEVSCKPSLAPNKSAGCDQCRTAPPFFFCVQNSKVDRYFRVHPLTRIVQMNEWVDVPKSLEPQRKSGVLLSRSVACVGAMTQTGCFRLDAPRPDSSPAGFPRGNYRGVERKSWVSRGAGDLGLLPVFLLGWLRMNRRTPLPLLAKGALKSFNLDCQPRRFAARRLSGDQTQYDVFLRPSNPSWKRPAYY